VTIRAKFFTLEFMTLILELPDKKETALKAKALAQGLSAEQYAQQVLDRDLEETVDSVPFWKSFTHQMEAVPDRVFENMPVDGASEHDHYLYGSPKRSE